MHEQSHDRPVLRIVHKYMCVNAECRTC
jgi:hypothetical protein